jgi:hypothetical protein
MRLNFEVSRRRFFATWFGFIFAAVILLAGANAYAQSVKGTLSGTVTDPTNDVIANASVDAVNQSTGEKFHTVTSSSGSYRFPELSLGSYTVTVTSPGFSTGQYKGVLVTVNNVTVQDVSLAVGQTQETVSVQANAVTLQSESSDISGTISSKEITELPLALGGVGALRSPQGFMFLLPGNTGPGAQSSYNSSNNNNGVSLNRIGGGQNFGAEVLIDGASQSRTNNGSNFDEEAPSIEALQEFKTTTSMPSAEFGRTTGGVLSFASRGGSNLIHGTVYDIFKNDALDANAWFNNGNRSVDCVGSFATPSCFAKYARQADKQNDYGGTLGGPVVIPHIYNGRDRTFFFFSWEQFRQSLGASITSTVPTDKMRHGDFSEVLGAPLTAGNPATPIINPCDGTPIRANQIFDPSTTRTVGGVQCRTAFPGNIITGTPSAVAQNYLAYYPAPQGAGLTKNFTYASTYPINNTTYTLRIDESITSRDKIFASYSARQNTRRNAARALPDPVDPNEFTQNFITHFGRFGYDHIFSPTLLNHLNFGSNRALGNNFAIAALGNVNYANQLGIGNISSFNFPVTTVGDNITQLGNGTNNRRADNSLLLNDSIDWQKGRHNLKFGVDVRYFQLTSASYSSPSFGFSHDQTAAEPTLTSNTGYGFASLYLGLPQTAATQVYAVVPKWIHWYYAGFVQDDFKVTKNLVLNLGLRYEIETPRYEGKNASSNFSPTANDPAYSIPGAVVFGPTCHCDSKWLHTWKKDVGPRVGFAYTPDFLKGRTTFRGGGAILYGPLQYFDSGSSMQTGFSATPSFTSSDNFTPAFAIDGGFPSYSAPPNFDPGFFNGQNVTGDYIAPGNARPGTIYMWSAQVQQQVSSNTILSVGYQGQRDNSLPSNLSAINNIPKQYYALGNGLSQPLATNTVGVTAPFNGFTTLFPKGTVAQALRPFAQYQNIASGCCFENKGQGSYNALLISLNRQFSNGLHYLLSYTWEKNLTDADSSVPANNAGGQNTQDPTNLKGEKALSIQDVPHTLVLSYLYDLPFGRGRHYFANAPRIVDTFIGGWQLGGIQRYQSGTPFAFACASAIPGTNTCTRYSFTGAPVKSAAERSQKLNPLISPHDTTPATTRSNPAINSLFNGAAQGSPSAANQTNPAFIDQNNAAVRGTGAYTLGDVPRVTSVMRLNPFFNEDFSLIKKTPIREGVSFILEVEALNAFNRHAWATPGTDPNGLLFGVPTNTIAAPRQMQIVARISF